MPLPSRGFLRSALQGAATRTVTFTPGGTKARLAELIEREAGSFALEFVQRFIDLGAADVSIHLTTQPFEIDSLPRDQYRAIANLARLNDSRRINKFLEAVSAKLPAGGRFVGCLETSAQRSRRLLAKYPPLLAHLYLCGDFVFKRVFPKLPGFKQLYFWVTDGRNRVLTFTEAIGRLHCCGFRLEQLQEHGNLLFFAVVKERAPSFDTHPSYGVLFGMRRIGRGGKEIVVWKIRTMHAYAEYLQEYVYEQNHLDAGGKFKHDFRLSPVGRVLRKVWLDELPMVWNLLCGEIKLVGVRPLSRQYLSLLPLELRERRLNYTPGLIPPYYADMPTTLDEIAESEMRYFDAYDRHPIRTDIRYLMLAVGNIVFRGARSR